MGKYPVNLELKDKAILLIGAGSVALRKFKRLAASGAVITVVSLHFSAKFRNYLIKQLEKNKAVQQAAAVINLCQQNDEFEQDSLKLEFRLAEQSCKILLVKRAFKADDLTGKFLAFAATADSELNYQVFKLAHQNDILVNIADAKYSNYSDFTLPALIQQGDLQLTAATGANLPALAKNIKQQLADQFGFEYQLLLAVMAEIRPLALKKLKSAERQQFFRTIAAADFLNNLAELGRNLSKVELQQQLNQISQGNKNSWLYQTARQKIIKLLASYQKKAR